MLSVCGSIYQNDRIVEFVRSILDNASYPDEIEFCVVDDEAGSDLMEKSFDAIYGMTKHLKVLHVLKSDRIAYLGRVLAFYEKNAIYPQDHISDFKRRFAQYISGEMPRLWFPPSRNLNKAVAASSGDVTLVMPLDLIAHFDLSKAYWQIKAVLTVQKHFSAHLGLKGVDELSYHSIRIFDRPLFDASLKTDPKFSPEPFGFDERWFILAYGEDEWNMRSSRIAWPGGRQFGRAVWSDIFGWKALFSMPESPWFPEYLCSNMSKDADLFRHYTMKYLEANP